MDTRQLRHFVAVAETLHFGKAAERLGMTQPPLSQSIMALEQELGAPLFVRTKRSVALTPFAAQWFDHVRTALDGVAALPATAQRIRRGETGHLDLSFVSTADYSVLPALVRLLRQRHPDVELSLTEATSDVQIGALLDGKAHAGIIIAPAQGALPDKLAYLDLISEPLIAAVPDSWIESGRLEVADNSLSASAVLASPLVVFPQRVAPSFYELVTRYYVACGGEADIAQYAIQMQTIVSLVSAGMGIALVPASMRNLARAGVRYVGLQHDAPRLQTGLAWRRDDTTPTLANLLKVARETRVGSV